MADHNADPSARDNILGASISLLDAYHRGERAAFVTLDERLEQRLSSQLDAEELDIVRSILALPPDDRVWRAALESIGPERSHALLETVLLRPRPPAAQVILEPMVERTSSGVTWLFERLEVGLTGVSVVVRLWADWPSDARFEPQSARHPYLRWTGFSHIADSSGRTLHRASTIIHARVTPVTSGEMSILRYAVTHKAWWLPGVAREARAVAVSGDVVIAVGRWTGETAAPFVSETVDLGTLRCEVGLPETGPTPPRVPSRRQFTTPDTGTST